MEYCIWWAGSSRECRSRFLVHREIEGENLKNWQRACKFGEADSVCSQEIHINKDVCSTISTQELKQPDYIFCPKTHEIYWGGEKKYEKEKEREDEKATVVHVGAVFSSVLTESNVLLMGSVGLSSACLYPYFSVSSLVHLEDQIIVPAGTWWNRVGIVC